MSALNKNNSAVKRIMQEAKELANDPCTDYSAAPLEDDIFEWHCTLRGPSGTEFEGGLYHFRIVLPAEYPFRPPSLMVLTPNGRFELNTKICISFTNYHEEEWQPAWGVRTAIIGLQGFFPLKGQAALGVGSIEYPVSERKRLAHLSREWVCPQCQRSNLECLPDPASDTSSAQPLDSAVPPPVSPPLDTTSSRHCDSHLHQPVTVHSVALDESRSETPDTVLSVSRVPEATIDKETVPATPASVPLGFPSDRLPHRSQRPPLLLDTAICVLLVLALALLCRRVL